MAEKIVKKKWYPIVTPKFLGEALLGETYLDDPQKAIGRRVKVNLMQITGDVKNQSMEVDFEITSFKDKFETLIKGYYFSPSAIKRYVRRHITRIDDSIVSISQDGIKIRIKPFIITKSKVTKLVEYAIRREMKFEIINFIKKTNYEGIFNAIIKGQLQKEMRDKLSKIYPLKVCEIRIIKEEKGDSKETEMPTQVKFKSKKIKEDKQQS